MFANIIQIITIILGRVTTTYNYIFGGRATTNYNYNFGGRATTNYNYNFGGRATTTHYNYKLGGAADDNHHNHNDLRGRIKGRIGLIKMDRPSSNRILNILKYTRLWLFA